MTGRTHRPSVAQSSARLLAALLLGFAATANGHGNLTGQIDEVTARIRKNPASAELHLKRAELHRLHEEWREAAADYDRAEALAPGLTGVHLGRARMLLASSRFGEAKAELDKFLALQPAHVDAIATLGRVEAGRGNFLIAAEQLARAAALSPRPEPEYYVERASALVAAGNAHASDALRCIDEGMAKLGNLPSLGLFAIDLEVKLQHFDAALSRLDRLSALSPRKETWLARRGEILMAAGRTVEARESYRAALETIAKLPAHLRSAKMTAALQAKLARHLAGEFRDSTGQR